MAGSVTPKLEFLKVADNQIRIVTKGPKKTEDRTVTLGDEVEETDPFDNVIKVNRGPSICSLPLPPNKINNNNNNTTTTYLV